MVALHIHAFGRLRMEYGDRNVASFPTRHVEELFGYLLLNRHTNHSREKLMDILWPQGALDNARGRFSTTLWRLRSLFEQMGAPAETYLSVSRNWISFIPESPLELDLAQFEQYLAVARGATCSADHEAALRAAVGVYQGELYEGIYADWCLVERERLAHLYLRAMGQLIACLIQHQEYEESVVLGQSILQQNPLREEVHRALMYCYWQMGHWTRAVQQYQLCAEWLMDELQILPMPETIALYRQIVADRLHRAQNSPSLPAATQSRLRVAFHAFQTAGDHLNKLLDQSGN